MTILGIAIFGLTVLGLTIAQVDDTCRQQLVDKQNCLQQLPTKIEACVNSCPETTTPIPQSSGNLFDRIRNFFRLKRHAHDDDADEDNGSQERLFGNGGFGKGGHGGRGGHGGGFGGMFGGMKNREFMQCVMNTTAQNCGGESAFGGKHQFPKFNGTKPGRMCAEAKVCMCEAQQSCEKLMTAECNQQIMQELCNCKNQAFETCAKEYNITLPANHQPNCTALSLNQDKWGKHQPKNCSEIGHGFGSHENFGRRPGGPGGRPGGFGGRPGGFGSSGGFGGISGPGPVRIDGAGFGGRNQGGNNQRGHF